MKNNYYRLFFLTVTFYGIYVCNYAFLSDSTRDKTIEERTSQASSKWIHVKRMKLNVRLETQ